MEKENECSCCKEREEDICPVCGAILEHRIGYAGEKSYDGVVCPNGCNLYAYYM